MSRPFDLYLITEPDGAGLLERTACALRAAAPGRVGVQLRLKAWSPADRGEAAVALRTLTRRHGAKLIVNGEPALARAVGADGVQAPEAGPPIAELRATLGPRALVGASCHDGSGLHAAAEAGADFATLSPFHGVPGKGAPLSPGQARACMDATTLPVFALGGIDASGARDAIALGAAGVAVIRAVYAAGDPARAVVELLQAVDDARASSPDGRSAAC